MPNYLTLFSTEIKDLTKAEKAWWKEKLAEIEEECPECFEFTDKKTLWFKSEEGDGSGDIDTVATLISDFFAAHRPKETKIVGWANYCSKPVIDSFGGGACLITASSVDFFSGDALAAAALANKSKGLQ